MSKSYKLLQSYHCFQVICLQSEGDGSLLSYFELSEVFMARQTWVLQYFPYAISLNTVLYFRHLLTLINNTVIVLGSYKLTNCISVPPLFSQQMKRALCYSASAISVLEEPLETIWHLVCAVLTRPCPCTFNFDEF